jgi:HTH-type transcriptional regulator, osmoprotectant uptake regulator
MASIPRTANRRAHHSAPDERVGQARKALLEGVGAEIAASFPGITRLGGQVVAALYLSDGARSMDELSLELGRSKSNIFANLRGLEAAGVIERRRVAGARHDSYSLRGKYPDVVIGAYLARLRRVVHDKQALCQRALSLLGDARGGDAESLRMRLVELSRKYDHFAGYMDLLPAIEGPVDLEGFLEALPPDTLSAAARAARKALGFDSQPPPTSRKRDRDLDSSPPPTPRGRHRSADSSPPPTPRGRYRGTDSSPPPTSRRR